MPFGLSILAPQGHESTEYLLQVAKIVEEVLREDKSLGSRRDWMRDDIRQKLTDLDPKVVRF